MVPALFRTAASLPVSPSGKLARNQLPSIEPVSRAPITRLPADALEEQLLAAWCRVLGESQLGVDDDFFRRGGNSLLVVLLLEEVRRIAPQVRLADLFQYPTVRALASKLGGLSVPPPAPDTRREPDAMTLEVRARRRAQIERKREARRVADEQAG
jgi:aryl carrier-like protein